ncbi:MAG: class I SAM-dependent methyltransferase [Syntrophomonadaceae bacterium]
MIKNMRKNKDVGIYGLVAKWYDKHTLKSRLAEIQGYADEVTSCVSSNANILEVAPGPGYLSIELARRGFNITGVEISPDFVKIARRNAQEANVKVDFIEGQCLQPAL